MGYDQNPGAKSPANTLVRGGSSSGVDASEAACHAGGRGFESRRSRFRNALLPRLPHRIRQRLGDELVEINTGSNLTRRR
jgi:hypothetical protein